MADQSIADVVAHRRSDELISVPASANVADAVAVMAEREVGAVLVMTEDRLVAGVVVGHRPVLIVGVDRRVRLVDRQLLIVGADAVQVSVVIREHAAHQHLVRAEADPRDEVGR